jgi:hypothetical protein
MHHSIDEQMRPEPVEPLLPLEKKLIGWSLGFGIALMIVLTAISRLL